MFSDLLSKFKVRHFLFYFLLFAFSVVAHLCIGAFEVNGIYSALSCVMLFGLLSFLALYFNRIFIFTLIFLFLLAFFYAPLGIMYGKFSVDLIASVYETNFLESREYLSGLSSAIYGAEFLLVVLFISIIILNNKKIIDKPIIKPKSKLVLLSIIAIYCFYNPIIHLVKNKTTFWGFLSQSSLYPLSVIGHTFHINNLYLQEREYFNEGTKSQPEWDVTSFTPKYKNYVLVIGESMRADYMSLYGYPTSTTPFLDRVNGTIFQHYISSGPNTISSLQRTLYRTEGGNIIYPDNIMSLANSLNINTYWISNQGIKGKYDTLVARIGGQAKYRYFTKKGAFNSANIHDEKLLPQLEKVLSDNTNNTRLIVLHLIGSHPDTCERVKKRKVPKIFNRAFSCYVQSIKETDKLLEDIQSILNNKNESYSVIYFSDHGLSEHNKDLAISPKYKQNYAVPFIKYSSDDKERILIQNPQTAFKFMNGFAQWLGIKEKHLSQEDFFNPPLQKIKVFNWTEMVDFDSLEENKPHLP